MEKLKQRLVLKDGAVCCQSAILGTETTEELREIAVAIVSVCPLAPGNRKCPFCLLNGLTYASRKKALEVMSRAQLLEMFKDELECRRQPLAV